MSEPVAQAIQTAILRALAECGQSAAAAGAGISDTRISRWKSCAPDVLLRDYADSMLNGKARPECK